MIDFWKSSSHPYLLEWKEKIDPSIYGARERLIPIEESKSVRVKAIEASDFSWVFSAFGQKNPIGNIGPKLLRMLLARSHELVRHDVLKSEVKVDFKTLEHAVENAENFAKLLGITTLDGPSGHSAQFPHVLSDVGKLLGYNGWHGAQALLLKIKKEKNVDLKASDSKYHSATKTGTKAMTHKYSEVAVDLLRKIRDGKSYEI
jgi:hypothetical protein